MAALNAGETRQSLDEGLALLGAMQSGDLSLQIAAPWCLARMSFMYRQLHMRESEHVLACACLSKYIRDA